jgi:hypothetical protein
MNYIGLKAVWMNTVSLLSAGSAEPTHITPDGCARANGGAVSGFRLDRKRSIYQLQPFPHTDQPQAATVHGLVLIKSHSAISDRKRDFACSTSQIDFEVMRLAVLHRILQRLLQNPEQHK